MVNKFKKNDSVIVISGSNKGKKGKILEILGDHLIVDGVNLATIHKKPSSNSAGEIIKSPRKSIDQIFLTLRMISQLR